MFLIKIIRWLRGYVSVEVCGDFCERFLNLLSQRSVNIWNVKRRGSGKLILTISVNDFKIIRQISKKANCSIHILNKFGLPFIFFRHRKRKLFLIGSVCFIILLYFMSSFIWSIELVAADFIDEKIIIESLEKEGLKPGVNANHIDLREIKNNILIKHEEISWISINIKGTKAYVELRQRVIPSDIIPKDEPCNIVSMHDAVITKLEVLSGSSNIITGTAVKKGQLLVSGILDSAVEGMRKVHAMANIEGKVWIEKTVNVKDYEIIKVSTDRKTVKNALKILGFNINLFINSSIPYEKYDKIIKESTVTLLNDIVLPINLVSAEFLEYEERKIPIDEARAREVAQKICDDALDGEYGLDKIINKETNFLKTQDGYTMKTIYECILPLGKEERIIEKS